MNDTDPVLATYNDIRQQVQIRASVAEDGAMREEVFTRWAIDLLEEKGDVPGGESCACEAKRVGKISGYWLDRDMGRLTVFVSKFSGLNEPPRMPAADAAGLITGAVRFVTKCRMNWHRALEESSEGFAFGEMVSTIDFKNTTTTVIVLTDHRCPKPPDPDLQIDGKAVTWKVFDLDRFHRLLTSGREREVITIDFGEVGDGAVPFMKMPFTNDVYDTYLTMVPGDLLATIYREHGARLLEQNVRTFLQAHGKVNRGIRDTIVNHPEMFLAYNNGLCATAASIAVESEKGPVANIRSITDFQIVNGGQTTASLTSAFLKDKADLSGVLVQLKLSVIKERDKVGTIVSNISRFANSQNKVNEADLLANDAFHVKIEHLSRTVWAPAKADATRETKWFYERARGQYSDEKGQRRTSSTKLRLFEAEYPSSQWFTKTDLAKFENTWSGLPHFVSRGAQKNFAEFTLRLEKSLVPDINYFQDLAAKAVLFRSAERIVSGHEFGGYRANIVTYTLAWIAHHSDRGVDLNDIWSRQALDEQTSELINAACPAIHKLIVNSGGANVTEWCKQDACWDRIRGNDLGLAEKWNRLLEKWSESKIAGDSDGDLVNRVVAIGGDTWLSLARWGKETQKLEDAHRSVASTLARTINSSRRPSVHQATEGEKALSIARKHGFKLGARQPA